MGLTIDKNLDFSKHVSEVCKRSRKESGFYKKTMYHTFCQSQTYYIQVCRTETADVLSYRLEFLSLFRQQETGVNPRKSFESNL